MEIDLSALDHNYRLVESMVGPDIRIHPSVKSAAYGLGLVEVARRFQELGADAISCGSFEDACTIREAGLTDIELVMFGGTLPGGIPALLSRDLMPTVHTMELARAVADAAKKPAKIYIKVDVGWGRLGIPAQCARERIIEIARMPNVAVEGVYTHVPFTDENGVQWAIERTSIFDEIIQNLKKDGLEIPVTQSRSSAGVLMNIPDNCNSVAPGSILYGKPALPGELFDFGRFQPVLTAIKSRIIQVSPTAADTSVIAPSRFARSVKGSTGVIPYGRRDGNRAALPDQQSYAIVNGTPAPILSVSSELCVLDLSNVANPAIGNEVIILGEAGGYNITLETLARWQGSGMNDVLLPHRGRLARKHLS
ncbi:MAG: alanine racemase [Hyphomonas sp.]|nr:alanine racemase [Hyphomonas sp.]